MDLAATILKSRERTSPEDVYQQARMGDLDGQKSAHM
jgi:hypothetical protein